MIIVQRFFKEKRVQKSGEKNGRRGLEEKPKSYGHSRQPHDEKKSVHERRRQTLKMENIKKCIGKMVIRLHEIFINKF